MYSPLLAHQHCVHPHQQARMFCSESGSDDDKNEDKRGNKSRYTDSSDKDAKEYYDNYHKVVTGKGMVEASNLSDGYIGSDDMNKNKSEEILRGRAGESFADDATEVARKHNEMYQKFVPGHGMIDAYEITSKLDTDYQAEYKKHSDKDTEQSKQHLKMSVDENNDYYDKYNKLFGKQGMLDASRLSSEFSNTQSFPDASSATIPRHNATQLTHVDDKGSAHMVDVGSKYVSKRVAIASGFVQLSQEAFQLVKDNQIKKGDVLTVSQIAGIMAAKRTSSLIPLCHTLNISKCDLEIDLDTDQRRVVLRCEVQSEGKTGVELEALTGVTVAALTVYDMCKAVTQDIVIGGVQLESKTGGQRGDYFRDH